MGTKDTLLSVAIHTNLVKIDEAPKSWDDLSDPKFRTRTVWGSTPSVSAAAGFIGLALQEPGEERGKTSSRRVQRRCLRRIQDQRTMTAVVSIIAMTKEAPHSNEANISPAQPIASMNKWHGV